MSYLSLTPFQLHASPIPTYHVFMVLRVRVLVGAFVNPFETLLSLVPLPHCKHQCSLLP